MNREQWLEQRRSGIGGSDVAAILGICKWRTAVDVYLDKIGEGVEQDQTPAMLAGSKLERAILEWYVEEAGREIVCHGNAIVRHPEHAFMLASLDAITPDGTRVIDAKNCRTADGWGEPGTDEIPPHYQCQGQHYMAVTGAAFCDFAVLVGGQDFRVYTLDRDEEWIAALIDAERAFWAKVESRTPPDAETPADVVKLAGPSVPGSVLVADDQLSHWLDELSRSRDKAKAATSDAEFIETQVKAMIGGHESVASPAGAVLATWKTSKPTTRLDADAVRKLYPDVAAACGKTVPGSRRFVLKIKGAGDE